MSIITKLSLLALLLLGVCIITNGLPTKRSTAPVCNGGTINQYILNSFQTFSAARKSTNCTKLLEDNPDLNKYYCQCNAMSGIVNKLDTTITDEEEWSEGSIENNNSTVSSNTTISSNSTFNETAEKDEYKMIKGCWSTFEINIEKGKKKILGGDFSMYKLPKRDQKELIVKLFDKDGNVISERSLSSDANGEWVSLPINSYATSLPYGEIKERMLVTVSVEGDDYLTCDKVQEYFIMTCSATISLPTPSPIPSYFNLEPMTTLLTEKTSSSLLGRLRGKKRREVDATIGGEGTDECVLKENKVLLTDISPVEKGHVLVAEDGEMIDIGRCVSKADTKVPCRPKGLMSHRYMTQDTSGKYLMQEIPRLIATEC